MNGVEFREEEGIRPRAASVPAQSKAAAWLVTRGIARTEKEANMMLLGAAGIIAALALVFLLLSTGEQGAPPVTEAERLRNELSTPAPRQ